MSELIQINFVAPDGQIWQLDAFQKPEAESCVRVFPDFVQGIGIDDAINCARHLESGYAHGFKDINLKFKLPEAADRDSVLASKSGLAFAAVLADLALRQRLCQSAQVHWLLGNYSDWSGGELWREGDHSAAYTILERFVGEQDAVWIAPERQGLRDIVSLRLRDKTRHVAHLGALCGGAQQGSDARSKRVYFPVVDSNLGASLLWVHVSVRIGERESVDRLVSLDSARSVSSKRARRIPEILGELRALDKDQQAWDTRVHFSEENFSGDSYELALALAYRVARGYEPDWAGGRLLASGRSLNWAAGVVESVDGREQKMALLQCVMHDDDRLLLPADWQGSAISGVNTGYVRALQRWAS